MALGLAFPLALVVHGACTPFGSVTDIDDSGDGGAVVADPADGPEGCVVALEPKDSPACVDEQLGIFVSASGRATGEGTKTSPLSSISKAVALAASTGRRSVFVCAGTYYEHVVVSKDVSLYGGFSCVDWRYLGQAKRAKVTPLSPGFALELRKVSEVTIADLEFEAVGGTPTRRSSVAVFASESKVRFARVPMTAADGVDGANAPAWVTNYDEDLDPASLALRGHDGVGAVGGAQQECTSLCVNQISSTGGAGGNGGTAPPNPTAGSRGKPELGAGAAGPVGPCNRTLQDGASAVGGSDGVPSPVLGVLTSQGWEPSGGAAGVIGGPGQGGGGGGGTTVGAGGGGGCGGCGGAPGLAAEGGGGSIALASFMSELRVVGTVFRTAKGGRGGDGYAGQPGQVGGYGGDSTSGACYGGNGGTGGAGGASAGGAGGVSVSALRMGGEVTVTGDGTAIYLGEPGAGGRGGGTAGNNGPPGRSEVELSLD